MTRLHLRRWLGFAAALGFAVVSANIGRTRPSERYVDTTEPSSWNPVKKIETSLLDETPTQIRARFLIPPIHTENEFLAGTGVEIRGAVPRNVNGEPDIPVIRRLVAIPECGSISLSVTARRQSAVTGVRISDHHVEDVAARDEDNWIASPRVSDLFPGYLARIRDGGHLRGQRLAVLELSPLQYDRRNQEATMYEELEVTVTLQAPTSSIHQNTGPMHEALSLSVINPSAESPAFAGAHQVVGGETVAFETGTVCWISDSTAVDAAASVSSCGADYLIIVADTLSHGVDSMRVQDLADWRASYNGFNVAIVRVKSIIDYCDPNPSTCRPDTSDTPVAIRDFIKTVYNGASAEHMGDGRLAYVLLIGDTFDPERNVLMPMYYITSGPMYFNASFACDGAYALLTEANPEADLFPDVFLGRLPVDADPTHWEITNAVNRILDFEPVPASASWINRVLLTSGGRDMAAPIQGLAGFQAFFDSTDAKYIPAIRPTTKMHVLSPSYTDGRDFSAAVADSLRNGFGIWGLFDHGNFFYLAGKGDYGATLPVDHDALGTTRAPFVLAIGSHLGECDYTPDKVGKQVWGSVPSTGPCIPSLTGSCGHLDQLDARIDSCDVFAERLLVQPQGAIGVLALNRSMFESDADDAWNNFWDTQYAYNVTSTGQELVLNKLRGGAISTFHWVGGLSLFGDPAVNLRWRDGANDGSDLAIRNSDIMTTYASTSGGYLRVTIRNEGPADASEVGVEVWRGHPDISGSTLLGTKTVATVVAYDTVIVNVAATIPAGKHRLYVRLNPDFSIAEPTYDNNTASAFCYGFPYLSGFPLKVSGQPFHSVVMADVNAAAGVEVLFVTPFRLYCCSAGGNVIWSFGRAPTLPRTGPVVANFGKHGDPLVLWETAGYVYLLDPASGAIVDSTSVGAQPGSVAQSYAVGDLSKGDSNLEYVGHYGPYFEAHEPTGSLKWRVTPTPSYEHAGMAIGDIDLNGTTEVMIATEGWLSVYDGQTAATLWRRPIGWGGLQLRNELVAFDSDGDGDMELLTTSKINSSTPSVSLYDKTGTLLWRHGLSSSDLNVIGMAIGDLDASGTPEIVVGAGHALRSLTTSDAVVIDSTYSTLNDLVDFLQGVLIGDIVGDARQEVIAQGRDVIQVFDADLSPLDTLYFAGNLTSDVVDGPAIGDVNADGNCDAAVLTKDGYLHVFTLGSKAGELPWSSIDADPMHTSIYAQPFKGNYARRVSLFNTVHVLGDAVCDSSVYVDATARIRVADSDATSSGADTSRTEIWLRGHINVRGSERQRPTFEGWNGIGTSSAPDAWWGLFVSDTTSTGRGGFRYTDVRNAVFGIQARQPLTVVNCLIEECEDFGISTAMADSVVIDSTTIRGSGYGVNALQATTVLLSNSSIEDCPLYGVAVYKNSNLRARTTTFDSNDIGVYLAKETYAWVKGMVRSCTFVNNTDGIWIDDAGDSTVVVNLCTVDNSVTNGIYVEDGGNVLITRNTVTDGSTGIFSYHSGPMIDRSNHIERNGNGIKCDASSYAAVESCLVANNNYGITVVSGGPNIGTLTSGDGSDGYNILKPNTTYNVRNLTGYTVSAQQNWWPQKATPPIICYPKPSTIYGSVDTTAALCTQPSLTSPAPMQDDWKPAVPRAFGLSQNCPNPFNPSTTINFEVAAPSYVKINVYDVSGKLVAVLLDEQRLRGSYAVQWNGRDRRGQPVASGVYFVRMQAGTFMSTKKLLLLK